MAEEIIKVKNGKLCFGNYLLTAKDKVDNFVFEGNKYKVKTCREITRLEKNDQMLLESVPGTSVSDFTMSDKEIFFKLEGFDSTQLTLNLLQNTNYKIEIDDTVFIDKENSGSSGKLCFSIDLTNESKKIKLIKLD